MVRPLQITIPRALWDPSSHCFCSAGDPNQGFTQTSGRSASPKPKKKLQDLSLP